MDFSRMSGTHLRRRHRIRGHKISGLENLDEFPRLKVWLERIEARPAVQVGVTIPKTQ